MPTIRFMKDKKLVKEVYVAAGTNLRQAALSNEINPHHGMVPIETAIVQFVKGCKGFGLCATCSVNVNSGAENLSPMGTWEKMRLQGAFVNIGNEDTCRLSCQTAVNGDCEIEIHREFNFSGEKFWEQKPQSFSVHAGSSEE